MVRNSDIGTGAQNLKQGVYPGNISTDAERQSSPAHKQQAQRRCLCLRCNDGFGTGPRPQLRSVKKELDLDSIEREDDPPILDAVKNPGVQ